MLKSHVGSEMCIREGGKRAAGGVQRKPAVRNKPAASDATAGPAVEQRAHKPGAVVSRAGRAVGLELWKDLLLRHL